MGIRTAKLLNQTQELYATIYSFHLIPKAYFCCRKHIIWSEKRRSIKRCTELKFALRQSFMWLSCPKSVCFMDLSQKTVTSSNNKTMEKYIYLFVSILSKINVLICPQTLEIEMLVFWKNEKLVLYQNASKPLKSKVVILFTKFKALRLDTNVFCIRRPEKLIKIKIKSN